MPKSSSTAIEYGTHATLPDYSSSSSSSSPTNTVKFNFALITRRAIDAFPELEGNMFLYQAEERSMVNQTTLQVNLDSLSSDDINKIHRICEVPTPIVNQLIDSISKSIGLCRCTVIVGIAWVTTIVHDPNESPEIRRIVDEFNGGNSSSPKPAPATEKSIELLENLKLDGESNSAIGECTICKEDFEDGSTVKRMPCSHVYHEECIIHWLQINHICPLCRFPMPHDS